MPKNLPGHLKILQDLILITISRTLRITNRKVLVVVEGCWIMTLISGRFFFLEESLEEIPQGLVKVVRNFHMDQQPPSP